MKLCRKSQESAQMVDLTEDNELQSTYLRGLAAKLDTLNLAKMELLSDSEEAADTLRRVAHQLKGSGATYGFPKISEAAELLEESDLKAIYFNSNRLIEILKKHISHYSTQVERILIIEDDRDLIRIMETKLSSKNRELLIATTVQEAIEHIEIHEISLILLDLILPDDDGRNFLLTLKERSFTASIPVIVMTAKKALAAEAECAALGADEFIEKPFNPDTLVVSVNARLQKASDNERALRIDSLTGLANRVAFSEAFERSKLISNRSGSSFSIGILDIDHFKNVNDTYGHGMGDEVLHRFAKILKKVLRKSDFIARWGGEEFTVLFPDTGIEGAKEALQKAMDSVCEEKFSDGKHAEFSISFSAGIASADKGIDIEKLISEADKYLYIAKLSGRARIVTPADKEVNLKNKIAVD